MKKVTFMAIALMLSAATLFASIQQITPAKGKNQSTSEQCTCPTQKAGNDKTCNCTKCGQKTANANYTCPMHKDVMSDKPGKCPKCKMNLQKKANAMHTCTIHKDGASNKPCKCSKCDMDLKKSKMNHSHKM